MQRYVALIITLVQLAGAVGMPVVAFSCDESGEEGLLSYLGFSPMTCYVETCCEDDQNPPDIHTQRGLPCCDINVQVPPDSPGIVAPDHTSGPDVLLPVAHERIETTHVTVGSVLALSSLFAFDATVNSPLRV